MSISTSHFVDLPAAKPPPSNGHRALVYFIPGNPGYVDWYSGFLHALRGHLDATQSTVAFDIYGRSLPGFNDEEHAPFSSTNPPYSLEDHIAVAYSSVSARRAATPPLCDGSSGRPYDFVVLMGHSVGAYIALEIFARHRRDPSPAPHLRLHHGILLCPTITHIAKSPCGRFFSFICRFALLRAHLHTLLAFLLFFIPSRVLYAWTRHVMGFTDEAASTATAFLKSRDAVWQTLYMGADEMAAIADDEWEEELWEVLEKSEDHRFKVPKFFFLFAKKDHWVSRQVRDEFIAKMRRHAEREGPEHKKGRTEIEIDDGRFPHAFCTREGECPVAVVHPPFHALRVLTFVFRVRCSCCRAGGRMACEDTGQSECVGVIIPGRGLGYKKHGRYRLRVYGYLFSAIENASRQLAFRTLSLLGCQGVG